VVPLGHSPAGRWDIRLPRQCQIKNDEVDFDFRLPPADTADAVSLARHAGLGQFRSFQAIHNSDGRNEAQALRSELEHDPTVTSVGLPSRDMAALTPVAFEASWAASKPQASRTQPHQGRRVDGKRHLAQLVLYRHLMRQPLHHRAG